ncbi:hypothetical protein QQF64_006534 [Cirrhinus molitorella]|uniref:Uncharacterized protein n=1 Tax=Cirrhinus molitorella TaxID=172907 RepID=A0ABR3MBD2_9TELE
MTKLTVSRKRSKPSVEEEKLVLLFDFRKVQPQLPLCSHHGYHRMVNRLWLSPWWPEEKNVWPCELLKCIWIYPLTLSKILQAGQPNMPATKP